MCLFDDINSNVRQSEVDNHLTCNRQWRRAGFDLLKHCTERLSFGMSWESQIDSFYLPFGTPQNGGGETFCHKTFRKLWALIKSVVIKKYDKFYLSFNKASCSPSWRIVGMVLAIMIEMFQLLSNWDIKLEKTRVDAKIASQSSRMTACFLSYSVAFESSLEVLKIESSKPKLRQNQQTIRNTNPPIAW